GDRRARRRHGGRGPTHPPPVHGRIPQRGRRVAPRPAPFERRLDRVTPRSRSLSLSLALHGALLTGLAWIGFGRTPDEAPAGVTVVWLETGLLDLAAASRGNGGIADTAEPDAAAELLPDPIAAVEP